jgi:hypothetical protein
MAFQLLYDKMTLAEGDGLLVRKAARFWSKVQFSHEGCWLWNASTNARGYGQFGCGGAAGGMVFAHRQAYIFAVGSIPREICVLHHCDNPICVRPDHLFLGTRADNMQDASRKGRLNGNPVLFGEAHPRTKISSVQVEELRALRKSGETYKALAHRFGLGKTQVRRIICGESRLRG